MIPIQIQKNRLDKGKHCLIHRGVFNTELSVKNGRDPKSTCLRVFDEVEIREPHEILTVMWGDVVKKHPTDPVLWVPLFEATQIQNICAWHGLAPRVYALATVFLGGAYRPVQLCEYLKGSRPTDQEDPVRLPTQAEADAIYEKVKALGVQYRFHAEKDDVNIFDVINGKLVDFNTFHFYDHDYKSLVKKIYSDDGKYGKVYYQNEPALGFKDGPRDSEARIGYMALDKIDFTGKSVLDVGCAGGYFIRYALDRGAMRATGFDTSKTVEAARNMTNFLGYFNADFEDSGEEDHYEFEKVLPEADIVFFLSMYMHIGFPDNVYNALKPGGVMIFEKNGRESDEAVEAMLRSKFASVELVGHGKDHGDKPIYHCVK